MIFGEILEPRAGPAEESSDADVRRGVVLAERIERERFLERLVRKEDAEIAAGGESRRVPVI